MESQGARPRPIEFMGYKISWEESSGLPRHRTEVLLGEWVARGDAATVRLPAWCVPYVDEPTRQDSITKALHKLVGLLEGTSS